MFDFQTEKVIYIATEPVTPLETHLKNNEGDTKNELAISWGLHQTAVRHISFLVSNLLHQMKEILYLTMHSTHFIYSYMASDIW